MSVGDDGSSVVLLDNMYGTRPWMQLQEFLLCAVRLCFAFSPRLQLGGPARLLLGRHVLLLQCALTCHQEQLPIGTIVSVLHVRLSPSLMSATTAKLAAHHVDRPRNCSHLKPKHKECACLFILPHQKNGPRPIILMAKFGVFSGTW